VHFKCSISGLPDQRCDDVAIIGGGVGGLYTAWRLRNSNLTVSLYEQSDRLGGRIQTVDFREVPGVNIELGAMRLLPGGSYTCVYINVLYLLNDSLFDYCRARFRSARSCRHIFV